MPRVKNTATGQRLKTQEDMVKERQKKDREGKNMDIFVDTVTSPEIKELHLMDIEESSKILATYMKTFFKKRGTCKMTWMVGDSLVFEDVPKK